MISTCPPSQDLEAFALGDLPEPALERIALHVVECPQCESHLREMDHHTDELLRDLQYLHTDTTLYAEQPVPEQLVEIARSVGRLEGANTDVSVDHGRRLSRMLLEGTCRLGRFELQSELGVGSFGYVFRALDTELDRTVALKVQRAGRFASDEEVERFLREARSIAQLKHPGIVAIHDTGRTEDEVCFLVTEYIDGVSLEEKLAESNLETGETTDLIIAIAEALQYAHENGIIHRDVKPSNIILDRQERPHVMDFGLAKRDVGDTMTSDGRVMGTPAYMSPEQARGESHQVDARSDIYSLGVILYELLSGERPFQGNPRMLLLQLLEDDPRPPRQLDPTIPRDLETICLKAMAKSPSRRYQSAKDLADDLRRYKNGEPIQARRMGYVERLVRWCRRYPLAACLFVAVLVGSVAGFSYLSHLSTYFVHETALDSARMEADMLEKINTYYSEEVVGRLDWKKIPVTHRYKHTPQSLPLPFTFMIDAGQRITQDETGMKVRIYSEHPWRKDGGPKDDFERRAIRKLQELAKSKSSERSYHEFTESDGQPVLRYARAQIMKESCKKCHNSHEQSPKTDWEEGDLAGVLSLTRPLARDTQRTREGMRGAFYMTGGFALGLMGIPLVLFWVRRRSRSEARDAGQ